MIQCKLKFNTSLLALGMRHPMVMFSGSTRVNAHCLIMYALDKSLPTSSLDSFPYTLKSLPHIIKQVKHLFFVMYFTIDCVFTFCKTCWGHSSKSRTFNHGLVLHMLKVDSHPRIFNFNSKVKSTEETISCVQIHS